MKKLLEYQEYVNNSELWESVDPQSQLAMEYHSFVSDDLNESIFTRGGGDQIINALSKTLFGSLSKVSMIDQAVEKVYSLKAKLIDQEYIIDKEFDKLQDKMKEMRTSGANPEALRSLRKQRDAKENEFKAFEKKTMLEIERGMKLLDDIIGGNKRRQAYADSVISQAEVNLADYEYKKAKREGKSSEKEISQLMQKLKDKQEELEDEKKDLQKLAKKDGDKPAPLKVTKGNKTA